MSPSFVASLREHARARPAAPALVWHGQAVSYGDLYAMACRERDRLSGTGLTEQSVVAVVAAKSPGTVALVLGCLLARLRVLLPPAGMPAPTLERVLTAAACDTVLSPLTRDGTDLPASTGLEPAALDGAAVPARSEPAALDGAAVPARSEPAAAGGSGREASAGAASEWEGGDEGDVCFVLTTSGSTGVPKLVPLHAGAIDRFIGWAGPAFGIEPGRAVLNYAPLNFDLSLLDVWTTLAYGGCAVLVVPDRATDTGYLLDAIAGNDVHVVQAVPMMYELLVDATRSGDRRLDGVRHVIFTGDAIPAGCLAELPRLFGRARFYNVYGCTETNDSFIHEVDASGPARTPLPIGRPLPGADAVLIGPDGAVVTGAGIGELYVATPFQTTGYLGDPQRTADRFVALPGAGSVGRRHFRSGDLVRRHEDGALTLEGRVDFRVKVRGVQVDTQHVERVIQAYERVAEAAVVAVPSAPAGHRLHAVVRRDAAYGLSSLALREHCARHLPRTSIPSVFRIVDDPLPRTTTGKVDRNQIKRTQMEES